MNRIMISTIPHDQQRYPTVGDYMEGHGLVVFRVSEMQDERYEQLVAVHELIEYLLVKARGISLESIDAFDKDFEDKREEGDDREPGWEPTAPYHKEHVFAEKVERMLADELGVDWESYDRTVVGL